jgi:hypothetical protein
MYARPLLAFAFSCAGVACGGGDLVLGGRLGDVPDATGEDTGGALADAGTEGAPNVEASRDRTCGVGSVVLLPTASGAVCSGRVADRAFRFALCTCTELAWVGTLTTDSFASTTGQPGMRGSVGVDGYVVAAQGYRIGGSFWIAGQPAGAPGLNVVTPAPSEVAGELRAGGGIAGMGSQRVRGDVFSDGNVTCPGMTIDGALHVPTGSLVTGVMAAKGVVNEPVAVPKPCDCQSPAIDVARVVDAISADNDDAASGVSPTDLAHLTGPKTLELPCGRYHFDQIDGQDLTLRLRGATVVSVAADVVLTGRLEVSLAPGAEVDLFVGGNFRVGNVGSFPNAAEAAKFRVYVAGPSVFLRGAAIDANLYAPNALVSSAGNLEMSGALYAQRFSFGGSVTIHYDEAIAGGRGCP